MPLAGLVITSLVIIALAIPLILNKIPKNDFYGFRTNRTMSGTDEEWYRANHDAGVSLFIAGCTSLLVCLVVPHIQAVSRIAVQVCSGLLVASVLVAVGYAFVRLKK